MDEIILKEIYNQVKNGYKVALATITKTIGSTPGKMGATMAVFQNGNTIGSVGGGMIEHKVLNKCVECLKSGEDYNFEYSLNDNGNLGMQCGGTAFGYIKVFKPKPKLIIIGGGHIGLALFKIAKNLDFYTIVIDDREEFANEQRFENVEEVYSGDIPNIIKNISINDNTYIVIATRGYEGDLISLRSVIDRNPMYIGMIGSMKKWIKVKETLINENINIEKLESVYANQGIKAAKEVKEEKDIISAKEIYDSINDYILDGMPCDRVNEVIIAEEDKVQWKRRICVHKDIWQKESMDVSVFYQLRNIWIKAFVQEINSQYEYVEIDESTMEINKK